MLASEWLREDGIVVVALGGKEFSSVVEKASGVEVEIFSHDTLSTR